jgi:hypothetical protein
MKSLSIKIFLMNLLKNFWVQEFLLFLVFYSLSYSEFFKNWIALQIHNDKGVILSILYIIFTVLNIVLFYFFLKFKKIKLLNLSFILFLPMFFLALFLAKIAYLPEAINISILWFVINNLLFVFRVIKGEIRIRYAQYVVLSMILFFFIILGSTLTPTLTPTHIRTVNISAIADLGNINSAAEIFYVDNNYFPSAQNGECLKTGTGAGGLLGVYLEGGKMPLYGYAKSDWYGEKRNGNIHFCSKETPIWYMPWKTKKVGTREYWYKTLSYKGEEDGAYLICAEMTKKKKENTQIDIIYSKTYEEANLYMKWFNNSKVSEEEFIKRAHKDTPDIYVYCILKNSEELKR